MCTDLYFKVINIKQFTNLLRLKIPELLFSYYYCSWGSVAASEILNLETYNELNFLARQMYVLRPIPIIFKISKIMLGWGFPLGVFGIPLLPLGVVGYRGPKNPKMGKFGLL